MTVLLALVILTAPFALAALLSWLAHRNDALHASLVRELGDPDDYRVRHDAEAARTRFERTPNWPASGVTGERR